MILDPSCRFCLTTRSLDRALLHTIQKITQIFASRVYYTSDMEIPALKVVTVEGS